MHFVKFTPLGIEVNGARRWFRLPANQSFQPAEIMKIAVIIFIPYLICRMGNKVHTLKGSLGVVEWGGLAALGVYVLTDNLSSAIIVMGISCCILFVVHKKQKIFLWMQAAGWLFCGGIIYPSEDFLRTAPASDSDVSLPG